MKNLFLIKKIKNCFSLGKDSFYNYFNFFYKKNKNLFFNFHNFNIFNIFLIKIFNFFINIKKIKNKNNEFILRKIRINLLKNYKNIFFLKNHHYIDKIEFLILKILKKKKKKINKNWYFKNFLFIKPYLNNFLKKYLNLLDKSNKFVKIFRNFIRCLIVNFLK